MLAINYIPRVNIASRVCPNINHCILFVSRYSLLVSLPDFPPLLMLRRDGKGDGKGDGRGFCEMGNFLKVGGERQWKGIVYILYNLPISIMTLLEYSTESVIIIFFNCFSFLSQVFAMHVLAADSSLPERQPSGTPPLWNAPLPERHCARYIAYQGRREAPDLCCMLRVFK